MEDKKQEAGDVLTPKEVLAQIVTPEAQAAALANAATAAAADEITRQRISPAQAVDVQSAADIQLPNVKELIDELQPEYRAALDPTRPDFDREQWREAQEQLNAAYMKKLNAGNAPAAPQIGEPHSIVIDVPDYNPKLDPDSPEFDPQLWQEEISKIDLTAVKERMQAARDAALQATAQLYNPDYFSLIEESTRETMDGIRRAIGLVSDPDTGLAASGAALIETVRTALLNASRMAAESQKMIEGLKEISSPDFLQRVQETVLKLALELPPEELEALKEEIAEEAPAADDSQTSLFDDMPDTVGSTGAEPAPKDWGFIQTFAEPAEEAQPKRKRKTRLEKLVEQGLIETILQNNSTNQLTKFTPNARDTVIDPITGDAKITRGDFILKIPHYKELAGLKTSTFQLLDALTLKLTANPRKEKEPTVVLTLDEYMQRRGLKDRKAAKEQAIADMEILKSASFTLEEISGTGKKKGRVSYRFVNLADSGSVEKNGDIKFTYGATFHKSLITAQIMPYSAALLQVNNHKYPNAYYMGRKIAELKNMNALHPNAGDIISVQTLLNNAPYIPSYEEVAASDRMYSRRIIEPFERDLNALDGAFTWEYCHENGRPLTDTELQTFSYEDFVDCNVKFTWAEYPDQTKRREALEAKVEKAKAAQEAGQKKKRGRPPKEKTGAE